MGILESIKKRPYAQHYPDELLEDMIQDATIEVKAYCNADTVNSMMELCIKDLVIFKILKLGAEALSSESHAGESQSYLDDLPKDLRLRLNRIRRLPR